MQPEAAARTRRDGSAGQAVASEAQPVSPFAAWSTVAILLVLLLVSFLDRQIISLLVDPIKADLGLSDTQIGLLQGFAFTLFYSSAALPLGWAVDRYPRRIVCYLGVSVWSLGTAACGLAGQFWHIFIARLAVGAGEASLNPSAVSLISDNFPRDKVGKAMGIYISAVPLGGGVALIVGGLIIELFAGMERIAFPIVGEVSVWQAVFLAIGTPGLAFAFLAFLLTDRRPASPAHAGGPAETGITTYLRDNFWLVVSVLSGFAFSSCAFYSVASWTPAFLGRTFGLRSDEIGLTWGLVTALSGAGGAIIGGFLIDRFSRAGLDDAPIAVPAFAALCGWPFLTFAYEMGSPLLVLVGLGVGTSMIAMASAGALAVWQLIAPSRVRGRMSAIFGLTSTGLGATFGPMVPALLTDHVFGDDAMVGTSLSIVLAVVMPLMAGSLFLARRLFASCPVQRELAVPAA